MILIGQYDSPFVRRVAVAMQQYDLTYEHRPWSVWAQAEEIAKFNPLRRVPVLVLDRLDGNEVLVESAAILDALDDLVGPDQAMIARTGAERRDTLRVCALATGLADKAVSLLYERVLRPGEARSAVWVDRCAKQIADVLDVLEAEREKSPEDFWFGRLTHADVAVACALRFLGEAHPAMLEAPTYPALRAHAARCEALPSFAAVVQTLHVAV
jgi:glutathione S-transferase